MSNNHEINFEADLNISTHTEQDIISLDVRYRKIWESARRQVFHMIEEATKSPTPIDLPEHWNSKLKTDTDANYYNERSARSGYLQSEGQISGSVHIETSFESSPQQAILTHKDALANTIADDIALNVISKITQQDYFIQTSTENGVLTDVKIKPKSTGTPSIH